MKLIVGLGNPGEGYGNTRHNVGFMVIDEFQKVASSKKHVASGVKIFKSQNFMNDSGKCVNELIHRYKVEPEDLYIIHDDLDIKLGEFKIQFGRGPKDHNGIKSIDDALGTNDYWRVRVGIDNRPLDNKPMGEEYVLQNFTDEEKIILDNVINEVCKKLATLLKNTN